MIQNTISVGIQAAPSKAEDKSSSAREVTRSISVPVQCMLWGKAAGRCEFAGCNKPLWKSSVTQEALNIAQKAHIYSFSGQGPRGHRGIKAEQLNSISNLMLVCHECHQKIDDKPDGGRYAVALLQRMKREHEQRIELITGLAANKRSHILLYGANIGDHNSPLEYSETAQALFPHRYPAQDTALDLATVAAAFTDRDDEFWTVESKSLRRKFDKTVRERHCLGAIDHLSVFALAPQPLLILLGVLLGDIVPADVYQRHREPPTWAWPDTLQAPLTLELRTPSAMTGPPALVIALSATVTPERITRVLGPDAAIWSITTPVPHNDLIKSQEHLSQLRTMYRRIFDQIKAKYGAQMPLHVFPVCSVSAAVEVGRVRMPKADMPWIVYDESPSRGGFASAIEINNGDEQ